MWRWAVLTLLALSACTPVPVVPERANAPPPARPEVREPSAVSKERSAYYARLQQRQLDRGLMRTDDGAEIRVTREQLVDNFMAIALHSEYADHGGQLVPDNSEIRLQRWVKPVSIGVVFGDAVTLDQRKRDREVIRAFAARLQRVTGHPVTTTVGTGNFNVVIMTEDERQANEAGFHALMPHMTSGAMSTIVEMPVKYYCLAVAADNANDNVYARAVAVIRAEAPPLLRLSCIHEELAQGMGLVNDSPRARPSVFNDDEEFALLTPMDEMLLRILYDKRLHPGMTAAEARPIVETIATEIMGGDS